MKALNKSQLEVGHIYKCLISNRDVFILNKSERIETLTDKTTETWIEIAALSYNPVTGYIESHQVYDYSLSGDNYNNRVLDDIRNGKK